MALLRQRYAEKKELQPYCYNQGWNKNGGLILGNSIALCEMSRASWQTGKLLMKRPTIPFGAMVKNHPIATRDLSRYHQFGKLVSFLGMHWWRGEFGKETFWLRKMWNMMDASEFYRRRTNAKEVLRSQKGHEFMFPVSKNCFEETTNSKNPLKDGNKPWGAKISVENFEANRESVNRQNQQMTLKPVPTSGRFKVTSSVVITMNLEFNSFCPRKKIPIPLKYIDATRSSHTDFGVMQEKRIDDYWKVDSNRRLSDSCGGFTKFSPNGTPA